MSEAQNKVLIMKEAIKTVLTSDDYFVISAHGTSTVEIRRLCDGNYAVARDEEEREFPSIDLAVEQFLKHAECVDQPGISMTSFLDFESFMASEPENLKS